MELLLTFLVTAIIPVLGIVWAFIFSANVCDFLASLTWTGPKVAIEEVLNG